MKEQRIPKLRLFVVLLLAASSALIVLLHTGTARGEGPQTPAELWQSWSSEMREEYVWGYLSGFSEGKQSGCSFYADKITPYLPHKPVAPEKLPRPTCLSALPDFPKPTRAYAETVTSYYAKYPNDRQAGVPRLLLELASPPGLSIDEIHAKLTR